MAWPKKGTRKITVDGKQLLWHYSGHCPLCSNDVITIGISGQPHVLYIDPFPWKFQITPSSIANAVRWAIKNEWTPEKGPTKAMSLDSIINEFFWLPEGKRHNHCN